MYAYTGVLTALYERERTGHGSLFDVALLDALGEWMRQPCLLLASTAGSPPRRTGARHASISPYGPFAAARRPGLPRHSERARVGRAAANVLGRPDLASDPRFATNPERVAHDDELTAIIEAALAALTRRRGHRRSWRRPGSPAPGCARRRLTAHPQLRARDRWREVGTPGGPIRALLPPVTVPGREAAMGPVPALGEHTAAVLAELSDGPCATPQV